MQDQTFSFGRNWQEFLACVNEDRKRIAEQSIRDFMKVDDLKGKTFVDVGCGSGLFSLAAHRLGAERIVSLDVDPFSVQCCRHLHEEANSPENWRIIEGSVLDADFVASLGQFDVVYSWGVLHHTGDMWTAIRHAAGLVNDRGRFYLSIYNRKRGLFGSATWLCIKKLYNRMPGVGKKMMLWAYMAYYFQSKLLRFKNPFRLIREYPKRRGMAWRTNLIDWIGGHPYEYATVQEIFDLVCHEIGGFTLSNLQTTRGLGTNSFLFDRRGDHHAPPAND